MENGRELIPRLEVGSSRDDSLMVSREQATTRETKDPPGHGPTGQEQLNL